jgi:L-lactate dehydrogenase complex protein LldF
MISEEIELNPALEGAGLRVVETDLGEYIAQLAREHPSHIVAPIIHKSREDVAHVLRERLGATEADVAEASTMTAFARRTLRGEFLRADMGISGANFGVAETGGICLVTNEGNGRLTTTIPPIHVALMGIERIVPTMRDLGVMLQVLARSATGQKLTVYSNIVIGPRRRNPTGSEAGSEPDGPDELHVIVVDNGRSDVLGTELAEILYCIRCGACLNACPVYRSIGGHAYGTVYSGPVGSVLTPALRGLSLFGDLPHASSLCGACREICPVRIDIPRMLLTLRARGSHEQPVWIRSGIRAYARLATRPWLFATAAFLARVATRAGARQGWIRSLPGPLRGWTAHRDFPAFAPRSFQQTWRARKERQP